MTLRTNNKDWKPAKYLQFRSVIDRGLGGMEAQEVLRIDDEFGREYMWDGTELYRLKVLKGKFGRPKKENYDPKNKN